MADKQTKIYSAEEISKIAPNYKGKPENFVPNFRRKPQQAQKPASGQQQSSNSRPKPMPLNGPPPPRHAVQNSAATQPLRNESLYSAEIFGPDLCDMQPLTVRREFQPTMAALDTVINQEYEELSNDSKDFAKTVNLPLYAYYVAQLTWLRIIGIKKSQSSRLTETEVKVLEQFEEGFNITEPSRLFLKTFGTFSATSNETLYASFPPIPTAVINGFGGYYNLGANAIPITTENHNLYEEIPALGVYAERVRASLVERAGPEPNPGSALTHGNLVVNTNCLGYGYLPSTKAEFLNRMANIGFTDRHQPEDIQNTTLSLKVMEYVSDKIALTKTFKLTKVNLLTDSGQGSIAQQQVQNVSTPTGQTNAESPIESIAIYRADRTTTGVALAFRPQFMKSNSNNADPARARNAWCCVNNAPAEFFQNRNIRRTLPPAYSQNQMFTSPERKADQFTREVVRKLVVTVR